MKAFQRILAVVMALVMSLSVIGMVAFAAEGETTVTTVDTINTDAKGSITIHKYEFNGDNSTDAYKGTGEETTTLPEGAAALKGAGFTIYKVADIDALTNYYSANPTDLPAVSTYVEDNAIKATYANTKVGEEKFTGEDGIAKFENLDLGLYIVIETTTPDAVTDPCDPFMLSVPMTKVDGSEWLYDIHVYPKNGTSYGKVELIKKGENDALLNGVTFVLQKQDGTDADGNTKWIDITKQAGAQGDNTGAALNLTTNSSGKITVEGLSNGTYRFVETSVGENAGYIMDGATAYEFAVTDGKITYNNTTSETATINVSNEKPDQPDKKVVNADGTKDNDADYSIGDTVPYEIVIDVPSNIAKLRTFTVTDTPTNLEDKADTVKVYAPDDETVISVTATATANKGFTIEFNTFNAETGAITSKLSDYAGKQITIKYDAVLLDTAAVGSTGNKNTVELKYSNKITPDGDPYMPDPGTPGEDKVTDEAIVYTFELDVKKENETGEALANVEFDLYQYKAAENETVTEAVLKTKGTKVKESLKTDSNGKITVSGLENGDYYLVETKTVDGYNLLKAPVKVEINVAYAVKTTTETEYDENGDVISTTVTTETFTENSGTANDGIFNTTVINKKGFNLPQTGGLGTLMFILIGGVLIAGGVCLITVPNKKRAA